jgi:hypothetical protein
MWLLGAGLLGGAGLPSVTTSYRMTHREVVWLAGRPAGLHGGRLWTGWQTHGWGRRKLFGYAQKLFGDQHTHMVMEFGSAIGCLMSLTSPPPYAALRSGLAATGSCGPRQLAAWGGDGRR